MARGTVNGGQCIRFLAGLLGSRIHQSYFTLIVIVLVNDTTIRCDGSMPWSAAPSSRTNNSESLDGLFLLEAVSLHSNSSHRNVTGSALILGFGTE